MIQRAPELDEQERTPDLPPPALAPTPASPAPDLAAVSNRAVAGLLEAAPGTVPGAPAALTGALALDPLLANGAATALAALGVPAEVAAAEAALARPAEAVVAPPAAPAAPGPPPAPGGPPAGGPAPAPVAAVAAAPAAPAEAAPAPVPAPPEVAPAAVVPEAAGPTPRSPADDPAFQATVERVRATAGQKRSHQPATSAARAAQAAAPGPRDEVASAAAGRQVGAMEAEQPKPFDRAGFKARLLEKINAIAPKNPKEARGFADSDKLTTLKSDLGGEVASKKQEAQGGLQQKAAATPDQTGIDPKPVEPLAAPDAGPPPGDLGAAAAAPKALSEAEVSGPMAEGSQQLDQQLREADVTEEQLAAANEPEFAAALEAKKESQAHSQQAPQAYRQEETQALAQAQEQAVAGAQEQAQAMHADREQVVTGVAGAQETTMSADQQARAEVAAHIQGIYERTKQAVEERLKRLDQQVNEAFQRGTEAARKAFEDYVEEELDDRYSGIGGKLQWIDDKLLTWGLPSGIEAIFQRGRQRFVEQMDVVLEQVATIVEAGLTEAKLEVAKGRQEIATYVGGLPASLQKVGQDAAKDIDSRFDALERSVDAKQDQLIDSLAQKYNESVQKLDERIEALRTENSGLLSKAYNAVAGVIKAILALKDLLFNILAKAASAIGTIITDPIGFLGNLVAGVGQGLDNFKNNILGHLRNAFMKWLFGALEGAGIQLPDNLDFEGILSIAMQVLGLTYQAIRARAVNLVGEDVVSTLERFAEPFIVLFRDGPGALWDWIKEQLGNLKDMILGEIEEWVVTRVVKAGIMWIVSLLNPASAFIRACKAIYDIVMFFVERGREIMDLINAVIDSITEIARGSLAGAAKMVEDALAKALPLAISFLASLLNLGGISDKIREVIDKAREPVTQAVDWLIGKAVDLVKAAGKLLGFGAEEEPVAEEGGADGKDVREQARDLLVERLPGEQPMHDVEEAVNAVARELQPQGLQRLYLSPAGPEGRRSILAEASDPVGIAELLAGADSSVEMAATITVSEPRAFKAVERLGKFGPIDLTERGGEGTVSAAQLESVPGQGRSGAFLLEPEEGATQVHIVSFNTKHRVRDSNASHAERQLTNWLDEQSPSKFLGQIKEIRLEISRSPCQDCARELCGTLQYINGLRDSNPISASLVYRAQHKGGKPTRPSDIEDLRTAGWEPKGPEIVPIEEEGAVQLQAVSSHSLRAARPRR